MMLQDAMFELSAFENIKNQQKMAITAFWDDSRSMLGQKAKEAVYKNHPYGRMSLGSDVSVESINRDSCFDFYKKHVSAHGARLVVVGKFDRDKIVKTIEQCFGTWSDKKLKKLEYPKLENLSPDIIDIVYNRNQVFMAFVGLSVTAKDSDFNALRLFDNILLKSMGSKMFAIREKTGLFYFCYGSAAEGAWHEPGMFFVATAIAPDRVQEAYDVILNVILTAADQTTDEEFDQAKELEINRYPVLYELNRSRAKLLLDLQEMGLPFDYYEKQVDSLRNMKKEEMIAAVKKIISKDKLACIRIGTF